MKADMTYLFNMQSNTLTEKEMTSLVQIGLSTVPEVECRGLLKITNMEDRKAIADALKYRKHPEENPLVGIIRGTIEALTEIADNCEEADTANRLYEVRDTIASEINALIENPPSN